MISSWYQADAITTRSVSDHTKLFRTTTELSNRKACTIAEPVAPWAS